ncbi:alpha/beta fold hydrolase [Pseudonocardia sp. CA-107938]|uniref:alpha/beta fold hydrolase n=1 Tax=Pseudonocardia sp. CA-107938 TaxID=3240021 RepID=UPI003D93BA8F
MFDGFQRQRIDTGEATIAVAHGGSGPPVLLLHGFPESSAMWHAVAPQLADDFTVVVPDLRGYGESSRPPSGPDHAGYSFRAMAADQVAVMRELGHERFAVVGHDRGARVTHRMALDHPALVERAAVLDILPTLHVYENVDRTLATAYYHWFLFIQPEPLPEMLISGDPLRYLRMLLGSWGGSTDHFAPEALAAYERAFADPEARHAMLEDYRAGASVDLEHDRADLDRRVDVPLLVMWGARGVVGNRPQDPVDVWRERASDVRGVSIDAGHFLVEERPAETLAALREFLSAAG